MKVSELIGEVEKEILEEKSDIVKKIIRERLLEIEEVRLILSKMEKELEVLKNKDIKDVNLQ